MVLTTCFPALRWRLPAHVRQCFHFDRGNIQWRNLQILQRQIRFLSKQIVRLHLASPQTIEPRIDHHSLSGREQDGDLFDGPRGLNLRWQTVLIPSLTGVGLRRDSNRYRGNLRRQNGMRKRAALRILPREIVRSDAKGDDRQCQRGRRGKDRPCRNPGSARNRWTVQLSADARQKRCRDIGVSGSAESGVDGGEEQLFFGEGGAAGIAGGEVRAHLHPRAKR